jgi:hypothetical protein
MANETTERDLARMMVFGDAPPINTVRMSYEIFLPEGFGKSSARVRKTGSIEIRFQGDIQSSPAIIDGYHNDDSYRSSRFFGQEIPRRGQDSVRLQQIQHENSLARTLDEKPEQCAIIRLLAKDQYNMGQMISLIPPNTKFFLEGVQEPSEEIY